MAEVIESVQGLEKKRSKFIDREPWNWLPMLKFFENNFFLPAMGLLILKNISKGTQHSPLLSTSSFDSNLTLFNFLRSK